MNCLLGNAFWEEFVLGGLVLNCLVVKRLFWGPIQLTAEKQGEGQPSQPDGPWQAGADGYMKVGSELLPLVSQYFLK